MAEPDRALVPAGAIGGDCRNGRGHGRPDLAFSGE